MTTTGLTTTGYRIERRTFKGAAPQEDRTVFAVVRDHTLRGTSRTRFVGAYTSEAAASSVAAALNAAITREA